MVDIKKLKATIEEKVPEATNVVIVPHNGIDFDAIGSALGLSLVVEKFKKPVYIIIDDPNYKIDYGVQLVIDSIKKDFMIIDRDKYLKIAIEEDLFILTDVNKSYLVGLKEELKNPDKIIIIDHHDEDSNTIESNNKYIDSNISSASEIITKLLCASKVKVPAQIAEYLLAGICLDTNKLTKNVSSDTMKITAKLLELGADMNRVNELFAEDFNSDRRVQDLVSKAQFLTFSIAIVNGDENVEYTKEELAKVADYLLKYKTDAAFAIGNIGEGVLSISARSKGRVNAGEIMEELSGGGNKYSGATKLTDCTIEEANKRLVKQILPPCYNE